MSRITESTTRHTVATASRGKNWATVIEANEENGRYFFTPDTMAFFSSVLIGVPVIARGGARAYFVTGERAPDWDKHRYTVRVSILSTGDVDTISELGAYRTPAEAIAARNFIAGV